MPANIYKKSHKLQDGREVIYTYMEAEGHKFVRTAERWVQVLDEKQAVQIATSHFLHKQGKLATGGK